MRYDSHPTLMRTEAALRFHRKTLILCRTGSVEVRKRRRHTGRRNVGRRKAREMSARGRDGGKNNAWKV